MNIAIIPLVSVCCETFNHKPYVKDALDGFLMQKTNFAFEVLIHDDASTDGTQDVIKEYAEKYPHIIKPIYQKENQYSKGIGIWNTYQFPRARGKYIALCEGDDYWTDPLKLQKQVDFLEANQDYSMVFANALVHWDDYREPDCLRTYLEGGQVEPLTIYKKWCVATASILVRSSVLQSECYKRLTSIPKLTFGDVLVVMAAASVGHIWYMNEIMTCYRRLDTGAGALFEKDHWLQCNSGIRVAKALGGEYIKAERKSTSKYFISALLSPLNNFPNNIKLIFRVFWFAPWDSLRELKWIGRIIKNKLK